MLRVNYACVTPGPWRSSLQISQVETTFRSERTNASDSIDCWSCWRNWNVRFMIGLVQRRLGLDRDYGRGKTRQETFYTSCGVCQHLDVRWLEKQQIWTERNSWSIRPDSNRHHLPRKQRSYPLNDGHWEVCADPTKRPPRSVVQRKSLPTGSAPPWVGVGHGGSALRINAKYCSAAIGRRPGEDLAGGPASWNTSGAVRWKPSPAQAGRRETWSG